MTIEIRPFEFRNAKEDEYRLWNESRNRIRAEVLPDDPPIPLEEMVQRLQNFPPYMEYRVWAAWQMDEPAIVAYGEVWLPLIDNLHLAHFDIHVLPEYRRQGLARRLLTLIRDEAQRNNRSQGMTGVFPEYRNRGLGRWLKAAMLVKTLAERPQAKYVRTGNADINAPMLKINTELGFKPYIAETVWQIATDQVSKYLD